MVKCARTLKHSIHVRNLRHIPVADRLIEGGGIGKHVVHTGHVAHVPVCDVFIKVRPIPEGLGHIRNKGNVPITDVTVGVGCIRFVREPQVDRVLKIGVGDRFISHIFRPVVGPVRFGREGLVN